MRMQSLFKKRHTSPHSVPPDRSPETVTPFFLDTAEETFWHSKEGKIWISFFVLFIVIALEIGAFIYATGVGRHMSQPEDQEFIKKTTPFITPTPSISDKKIYTISVLNGSGMAGAAADAKKFLEEEKFIVISVGNDTSATNVKTSLHVKQNVPEPFVTTVVNILKKRYALEDIIRYTEEGNTDITIIIGRQEASEKQ